MIDFVMHNFTATVVEKEEITQINKSGAPYKTIKIKIVFNGMRNKGEIKPKKIALIIHSKALKEKFKDIEVGNKIFIKGLISHDLEIKNDDIIYINETVHPYFDVEKINFLKNAVEDADKMKDKIADEMQEFIFEQNKYTKGDSSVQIW